jgi:hypothetical protein
MLLSMELNVKLSVGGAVKKLLIFRETFKDMVRHDQSSGYRIVCPVVDSVRILQLQGLHVFSNPS